MIYGPGLELVNVLTRLQRAGRGLACPARGEPLRINTA